MCPRPGSEFLGIIHHHGKTFSLSLHVTQFFQYILVFKPGDQIPHLFTDGEDRNRRVQFRHTVIAVQFALEKTRGKKVIIVKDYITDTGLRHVRHQAGLPYTLCQPGSGRFKIKSFPDPIGQHSDLYLPVPLRDNAEYRFIHPSREQLHSFLLDQLTQCLHIFGMIVFQPITEKPATVPYYFYGGELFQNIQERTVCLLICFFQHPRKITNRLV